VRLGVDSSPKTDLQLFSSQQFVKSQTEPFTGTGVAPLTSGWVCVVCGRDTDARGTAKTLEDRGLLGGVVVDVPLGYFLPTVVFSRFWSNISSLM
jgi:hypothetical protein